MPIFPPILYLSTNSGVSFTHNTTAGQTIYAIAVGNATAAGLHKSANGGNSWTLMDGLDVEGSGWMLHCSPDGTILVVAQNGGYLYVSTVSALLFGLHKVYNGRSR